jgi:tetratricopeptide (TPR) repeat protein
LGTARAARGAKARFGLSCGLLMVLLVGAGCASMPFAGAFRGDGGESARSRSRRPVPLRIERADAPADYDVLVGELAEHDGELQRAREAYQRAAEKDPESGFIHGRLAEIAWQLDDIETAVREAELAFDLDPDARGVRLFLGRLYRLSRNYDGLDRVFRDADGNPLDADAADVLYEAAFEKGDMEAAEALARQLHTLEPDQLRGTLALVTIFEQRQDQAAAEATIREALVDHPDHFVLYTRLAQLHRARGDRGAEIEIYEEILESHPLHYGILQRLAQAQIDTKQIEQGIETYQRIVEAYPEDEHSLRRLAALEFSVGRYAAAAGRLEVVLERDPDEPDVAFALGQILNATGDSVAALEAFERIGPMAPIYVDARIQIAGIHEAEGRTAEALAEIERARSIRRHRLLDFQAAALRIELGDFDGGVELLESLLDGSDADTEIYYQLGIHYGAIPDVDSALMYMQRVLEADPNNANALNYIGYSWAERGENLQEAEELIRRALEISPQDGYITDSLGWVYFKMAESLIARGHDDEALRVLDQAEAQLLQAKELTGGDSVVSEHLGDVLLLRGDDVGALDYYEAAVEMEVREAEQPMLMEKLDRLRRDLGRGSAQDRSATSGGAP